MVNKDKPADKAEAFMEPFCNVLKEHKHIKKIRIEGEMTNIVIEKPLEEINKKEENDSNSN